MTDTENDSTTAVERLAQAILDGRLAVYVSPEQVWGGRQITFTVHDGVVTP